MEKDVKKLQDILSEAKKILSEKKLDLSSDEDLTLAVMNLISIEEHLFFSAEKTGRDNYLDLLNDVRQIRKETMKQLIPEYEGEIWCVSKHLFSASMRLIEVGTKKLQEGKKEEAKRLFDQAYSLYSYFWGLRLKMLGVDGEAKNADDSKNESGPESEERRKKKEEAVKEFVAKLVDCCGE